MSNNQEFVELVGQMLNFLTYEQLAEDLNVNEQTIKLWHKGKTLPCGDARKNAFNAMMTHSLWNEM